MLGLSVSALIYFNPVPTTQMPESDHPLSAVRWWLFNAVSSLAFLCVCPEQAAGGRIGSAENMRNGWF